MDVNGRHLCFLFFLAFFPNYIQTLGSSGNVGFARGNEEHLRFPPNFLLGAATSAYQIEGAWNVSDKGESIWDRFTHEGKGRIFEDQNGDVAADSYHKYKEDVECLTTIGFNSYRFSVSWPRLLPTGFSNVVSEDGVRYYNELIDNLLENNIEPILTLYHWDHPQVIEDMGGWTNDRIVDWFGDYARVVFKEFGSKVKFFITVNEPLPYCVNGYSNGVHAPGKKDLHGFGEYLCIQNALKANARAYRIYEEEFKEEFHGSVGINIHALSFYPKNAGDKESVEVAFQFAIGILLNPIFSEKGDYPEIVKKMVSDASKEQGYHRSRLPELGADWVEYIRGTSDFLAVNHYTSQLVEPGEPGVVPSIANDRKLVTTHDPSWKASNSDWLKVVPNGFGDSLRKLKEEYNNPIIYITENGFSDKNGLDDDPRIHYFEAYVKEMLTAIYEDGVNVKGYLLWSLLDNFEWHSGYSELFGIVHVDFNDPERPRTLKKSANWWMETIRRGYIIPSGT